MWKFHTFIFHEEDFIFLNLQRIWSLLEEIHLPDSEYSLKFTIIPFKDVLYFDRYEDGNSFLHLYKA